VEQIVANVLPSIREETYHITEQEAKHRVRRRRGVTSDLSKTQNVDVRNEPAIRSIVFSNDK
jgi:hypothetical protein